MPKKRFPNEIWRTAFYYDCRTARERNLILRRGFTTDEDGRAPWFTSEVTGHTWFPVKMIIREVRGLPTDWKTFILQITDTMHDYYELPWGVINNARRYPVSRKIVRRSRKRDQWPYPLLP